MTFPMGALTIGLIFIYTAIKNMTVGEILRGEDTTSEPTSFLGDTGARLASFVPRGGSGNGSGGVTVPGSGGTQIPKNARKVRGVKTWPNGNVQVAAWIYYELKRIKFTGTLTSGYRTPAYSESLCYDMCGAPSCPGKCAGRSSNHSGKIFPAGAIDVSSGSLDELKSKIAKYNSPLKNRIGASDPIHFSVSGY